MNEEIVKAINASPYKAFVTTTGGGTRFIGDFLEFGGGSATILGFYVPYSESLFDEFIGGKPIKYASPEAARALAMASYQKAKIIAGPDNAIGIGCTASLGRGAYFGPTLFWRGVL
jgi:hypothetical protein